MDPPQNRERRAHSGFQRRFVPPTCAAKYLLSNPLPCSETRVAHTAWKSALNPFLKDLASVVGFEVRAFLTGRLVQTK